MSTQCTGKHDNSPAGIIARAIADGKFVTITAGDALTISTEKPTGYAKPTKAQIDALQARYTEKRKAFDRAAKTAPIASFSLGRIGMHYPVARQLELLTAHAIGGPATELQAMQRFIQATHAHCAALLARDEIGDDWRDGWPEPEGEPT